MGNNLKALGCNKGLTDEQFLRWQCPPNTDFTGRDLSYANLNLRIRDSELTDLDLLHADFVGANLSELTVM